MEQASRGDRPRRGLPAPGRGADHAAVAASPWWPCARCARAAARARPRGAWPRILKALGKRPVVVRHPMPYGDLAEQKVQRFATLEDMKRHKCTIEEMEEYEPHIEEGLVVYAGVDYAAILAQAEEEADVILWDGGNNDLPFYAPDVHITVVDPHRPGHELTYFPGRVNLLAPTSSSSTRWTRRPRTGSRRCGRASAASTRRRGSSTRPRRSRWTARRRSGASACSWSRTGRPSRTAR